MEVNLSRETIQTVRKALIIDKNNLESLLIRIECGRAAREKKEEFEEKLEEVKDALRIFDELSEQCE